MVLSASGLEKEALSNQHCLQGLYNNTVTHFRLLEKLQLLKVRHKLTINTTNSEVQILDPFKQAAQMLAELSSPESRKTCVQLINHSFLSLFNCLTGTEKALSLAYFFYFCNLINFLPDFLWLVLSSCWGIYPIEYHFSLLSLHHPHLENVSLAQNLFLHIPESEIDLIRICNDVNKVFILCL